MNGLARPLAGCLVAVTLALLSACAGLAPPAPPPVEFAGPDPNAPRLPPAPIDPGAVARIVAERNGIPYPILLGETSPDRYLASVRIIQNEVPDSETETVAGQ